MDVATQSILMKLPLGCVLMYNQGHINIRHECIGKVTNRFKPLHTNTAPTKPTQEKIDDPDQATTFHLSLHL